MIEALYSTVVPIPVPAPAPPPPASARRLRPAGRRRPAAWACAAPILVLASLVAGRADAEALRLKDGTVLQGEIVSREDSTVTFRSASLGEIKVPVSVLAETAASPGAGEPYAVAAMRRDALREVAIKASGRLDPSDHALFFMPTAFTPDRGSFMFRDFELLFLTLGFAPTASTTVTAGFLFPVTSEVQLLTAGFKQRLWSGRDGGKAVALTGNYTLPVGELAEDVASVLNTNLVFSARFPGSGREAQDAIGVHGAVGFLAARAEEEVDVYDANGMWNGTRDDVSWHGNLSVGLGMEGRLTEHSKFMVEYLSAVPFEDSDVFGNGILTMGFRLHGMRLSADIAGIRPLTDEDLGDFFLWPLLVVSYRI